MIDLSVTNWMSDRLIAMAGADMMGRILDDIATAARAKWVSLARSELNTMRQAYIQGISEVQKIGNKARVITLTGRMPNAVENGMPAFDLRETLLNQRSRLRRVSADGSAYGRVPFRHGTAGSRGQAGTPMGRAYGPTGPSSRGLGNVMDMESSQQLGANIAKAAKRLKPTRAWRSRAGTHYGGRLPAGMAPKLASHHKSDIYAGMVRVRHTYERATQTQYRTWRTISERNTEGWKHPGIEARHLAKKVDEYVRKMAPRAIRAVIAGALK
jgi:hypothetical protein